MKFKSILLSLPLLLNVAFASPATGDKAWDFILPGLTSSDKTVQMKDYESGVVLLNVWASWCKGCKREMPFFHGLGQKYQDKDFTVLAVNIDQKAKKANKFLKKLSSKLDEKAEITFAYDKKKTIAKAYEAKAIPFSLLIKNGIILKTYLGSFDESNEDEIIADIEDALK